MSILLCRMPESVLDLRDNCIQNEVFYMMLLLFSG